VAYIKGDTPYPDVGWWFSRAKSRQHAGATEREGIPFDTEERKEGSTRGKKKGEEKICPVEGY